MAYGQAGSDSAVVSLDPSGLRLDLGSAIGRHHLRQAGVITDIASLPEVPFIEPAGDGGLYALAWDDYQQAFNDALADGYRVVFVMATGAYDAPGLRLTARQVIARLTE